MYIHPTYRNVKRGFGKALDTDKYEKKIGRKFKRN